MIITTRMTIHSILTVKVITQNNSLKVNKTLTVRMIITTIENITIIEIIMIMRMIPMINRFIHMKMMTRILIREEVDLKDPKIKRLSLKKSFKVIK